jgi:hypothetical protein
MNKITRPKMADIVPEGKKGTAEVRHYTITEDEAKWSSLRATIGRRTRSKLSANKHLHTFSPHGKR